MPRVIVVILVAALLCWLLTAVLPLPYPFDRLLIVALVIWVVVELLAAAGYGPSTWHR